MAWVCVWNHLQQHMCSLARSHACLRIIVGIACLHKPCARRVITLLCAASTVQLTCRFSWKMKFATHNPKGTAGKGWKTREGKHGNVSSDSTSQGTLTSSRETKIKNPLLAAKSAQQEDGVVEERWREGEQWSLSLGLQMSAFWQLKAFVLLK